MTDVHSVSPKLFNGALEAGTRSVVILDAAFPRRFDLSQLTWFDHLVVHTQDIGGPASLHPDIPQRTGELLVRRRLVEEGLSLMRRVHLVLTQSTDAGIFYQATDEATAFTDSLRSGYARVLKDRATWLAAYISRVPDKEIEALIARRIDLWSLEFQGDSGPGTSLA